MFALKALCFFHESEGYAAPHNTSVSLNCSLVDLLLLSFQKAFLISMSRFIFSTTPTISFTASTSFSTVIATTASRDSISASTSSQTIIIQFYGSNQFCNYIEKNNSVGASSKGGKTCWVGGRFGPPGLL